MRKRIGVVTATRAEYGLLKNVLKCIADDEALELILFVTGTHLVHKYGHTVDEIIRDGFKIDEEIDILMQTDTPVGISKTMGIASILFGEAIYRNKLDMLIVLGDRYELLPVCQVAMCMRIPIAHISGGESTEGLIDDAIRHSITKMSYLHFPGCEEYRRRIIQLGENPNRVFNFGDVGVENILKFTYMSKEELSSSIGMDLEKKYFSVTFHPVTLENGTAETQINELLKAIEFFPQYRFVITKSNADSGGQIINDRIDEFTSKHYHCKAFESLGIVRYLSLLKYSSGIIGNSSSGIIEAPVLCIPTINIGDRQKGRLKANSIIDCAPISHDIIQSIKKALSKEFIENNCNGKSPYVGGDTARNIVNTVKKFLTEEKIDLKKKFYDVNFVVN